MRIGFLFLASTAATLMTAGPAIAAQPEEAAAEATAEASSAVAEDGREALACLNNRSIRERRFSKDGGYFASSGGEWWQNKARGCSLLAPNRSIRTLSPLTRQCSGDQIVVFQNFSQQEFGGCVLGDWEPVTADAVPEPGRRRGSD
jgi:hypothetical protein